MDLNQVIAWVQRLIALDSRVFEDVRSNPSATIPGVFIVSVSTLIAGLGGWLWWMLQDYGSSSDILVHSAIIGSLISIVLWHLAWLGLVYIMLTQVFRQRAYVEQLLRVMGLAATPLALMGLMFIPGISFAIALAALVLTFGLTTVAISTVTTADPAQILVANLAGFFVWAAVLTLLAGSGSNPHSPGIFLYYTTTDALSEYFKAFRDLQLHVLLPF